VTGTLGRGITRTVSLLPRSLSQPALQRNVNLPGFSFDKSPRQRRATSPNLGTVPALRIRPRPQISSINREVRFENEIQTMANQGVGTSAQTRVSNEQTVGNSEDTQDGIPRATWMELSQGAQDELKGDVLKKKIPMFDAQTMADDIVEWLEDVENFCAIKGIKKGETKISLAMAQMTYKTRKYLGGKLVSAKGYSWDEFKKELLREFPESRDAESGSRERLNQICKNWALIPMGEPQKLKGFHREFDFELAKLQKPHMIISNQEAVLLYLGVLEPRFAEEIVNYLRTRALEKYQKGEISEELRRNDPWTLEEVQQTAMGMSATAVVNVYRPGIELSGGVQSTARTAIPMMSANLDPFARNNGISYKYSEDKNPHFPRPLEDPKIKKELTKDEWTMQLAASVDAQDVKLKDMAHQLSKNNEQMQAIGRMMSDLVKRPAQQNSNPSSSWVNKGQNPQTPQVNRVPPTTQVKPEERRCYCCGDPNHGVRDCVHQKNLVEKGLVKFNETTRVWELKDGERMPFWRPCDPGPSRFERILEIAKAKGWIDPDKDHFMFEEIDPYDVYHLSSEGSFSDVNYLNDRIAALEVELRKRGDNHSKN